MRLAIAAVSEQAVVMEQQLESVVCADFLLHFFNIITGEFNDFLAADAEDMVVVALAAGSFEKLAFPLAHRLLDGPAFQRSGIVR